MLKILLQTILILCAANSFACECPNSELSELDETSYQSSDLIVIGEVIKTGTNYEIKMVELLKGNTNEKIIFGTTTDENGYTNSCIDVPFKKGKYLFYLEQVQKHGKIFYTYSICSGTRLLNMETIPISLSTNKTKSQLIADTESWINELRKRRK